MFMGKNTLFLIWFVTQILPKNLFENKKILTMRGRWGGQKSA